MKSKLTELSFAKQILILACIPLCGLMLYSGITIYDHIISSRQLHKEIESVTELTELSTVLADTIHELQKERGRSAGYLGSEGKKFSSEIQKQHATTDRAIEELRAQLRTHDYSNQPEKFHRLLEQGVSLIDSIEALREQVLKQMIPAGQAVGKYTSIINSFLGVIDTTSQLTSVSEISLRLISYSSFLKAKENMGIERAVLSNTFAADEFKNDFFKRFCTVLANQNSHLNNFFAYATPAHIEFYHETVTGQEVEQVTQWEQLAFEKSKSGGFGVSPEIWFSKITTKIDLMKLVENHIADSVRKSSETIAASNTSKLYFLLGVSALLIVLTLALSIWIAKNISGSLRVTVNDLSEGITQVTSASGHVSTASINLASAASEQSASIASVTDMLNKISEVSESNEKLTADANTITSEARTMVDKGLEEMRALQSAMDDIRDSGDAISAIIKTIDEIAFQTNILALNAAVEASRAGEAGAGFAIVADEVRNLAHRSAEAARNTTIKIKDSIQCSKNGSTISEGVGVVLEKIVHQVREIDSVVTKIEAASQTQMNSVRGIQAAVGDQELAVKNTAESTESTAAAAEELHALALTMESSLGVLAKQATIEIEPQSPGSSKEVRKILSNMKARNAGQVEAFSSLETV